MWITSIDKNYYQIVTQRTTKYTQSLTAGNAFLQFCGEASVSVFGFIGAGDVLLLLSGGVTALPFTAGTVRAA